MARSRSVVRTPEALDRIALAPQYVAAKRALAAVIDEIEAMSDADAEARLDSGGDFANVLLNLDSFAGLERALGLTFSEAHGIPQGRLDLS